MSEQMLIEWLKEHLNLEAQENNGVVTVYLKLKDEYISHVAFCVGKV